MIRIRLTYGLVTLLTVTIGLMATGRVDSLAKALLDREIALPTPPDEAAAPVDPTPPAATATFRFSDLPSHPDRLYGEYFHETAIGSDQRAEIKRAFQALLRLYEARQSIDDNFTLRVVHASTGEVLERYVLEDERQQYERTGYAHWGSIDERRRAVTSELVVKYIDLGYDRKEILVKWGRRNQILEARERDLPYLEHEYRLARYLGLSLLATEIGTVETFNNDKLVSRVGARGRYQIMPDQLRSFGVTHYTLETGSGKAVAVQEEWHPLLTLEPTMTIVRAFSNAVGHEIPGISAYHAGPFNIMKLYRLFLTERADELPDDYTVLDAYVWALTDGFESVRSSSSFRNHSRGYIPAGYGALTATEDLEIDLSRTLKTERVRLASGQRMLLSTFLDLASGAFSEKGSSPYEQFRRLNQHIDLPPSPEGRVPMDGDVWLAPGDRSAPIRFFVPAGTVAFLATRHPDLLDPNATFSFDESTFEKQLGDVTTWDRIYDRLVEDAAHFGFTAKNRALLEVLYERFRDMADDNPSYYRQTQLRTIRIHRMLWRSIYFQQLVDVTDGLKGRHRVDARPPSILHSQRP